FRSRPRPCRGMSTIRPWPTNISSTGSPRASESAAASAPPVPERLAPDQAGRSSDRIGAGAAGSEIRGHFHGGLFQAALQPGQRVVEIVELLVVELGEN